MASVREEFSRRVARADERLSRVPGSEWSQPYANGSWLRKEVLGHLIDSAVNNHLRFVTAALNGRFEGPGYDQNGWVTIHAYIRDSWESVLSQWRAQNAILRSVVENIPEDRLQASCRIGTDAPIPLGDLILSYLDHMDHHVGQITPDVVAG